MNLTEWGAALREVRRAQHLSLSGLARRAALPVALLIDLEAGRRAPHPSEHAALEAALGGALPEPELHTAPELPLGLEAPLERVPPPLSRAEAARLARLTWRGAPPVTPEAWWAAWCALSGATLEA